MHEYIRFRDQFAAALDPQFYTIQHVDHLYLSGRATLFTSENAAILAELKVYPTGAMDVHGLLAAGDLSEIVNELIPQAEAWGREEGCIGALIDSREGWGKVMKKHGYALHQQAIRKAF